MDVMSVAFEVQGRRWSADFPVHLLVVPGLQILLLSSGATKM